MTVLEEVLSRPGESTKPQEEQEHWVIALLDWTESYQPCFVVQQSCGKWSDVDRQFMFLESRRSERHC